MSWVSLVILLLDRALITFISIRTWVSVYVVILFRCVHIFVESAY